MCSFAYEYYALCRHYRLSCRRLCHKAQLNSPVTSDSQSAGDPSEAFTSADTHTGEDGREHGRAHHTGTQATSEDFIDTHLDIESPGRRLENDTTLNEQWTEDVESSFHTPIDVEPIRTRYDDGSDTEIADSLFNKSARSKGKGKAEEGKPEETLSGTPDQPPRHQFQEGNSQPPFRSKNKASSSPTRTSTHRHSPSRLLTQGTNPPSPTLQTHPNNKQLGPEPLSPWQTIPPRLPIPTVPSSPIPATPTTSAKRRRSKKKQASTTTSIPTAINPPPHIPILPPTPSTPLPAPTPSPPSSPSSYSSALSTQSTPEKQYTTAPQTPQHHEKMREGRTSTLRATATAFTPRAGPAPPVTAPLSSPIMEWGRTPPDRLRVGVEERTKRARGRCGKVFVEVAMEWLEGKCEGCDGWGVDRREGPIIARTPE